MNDLYPYKAKIEVSGPYSIPPKPEQEAWFYGDGTAVNVHGQIIIGNALYHVIISVPNKSAQKRTG